MMIIHLYRRDLRLHDLPSLAAAEEPIFPLFVLDDSNQRDWPLGGASKWWLHHSLEALDRRLRDQQSKLILRRGDTLQILESLVSSHQISGIYFSREYTPGGRELEHQINSAFSSALEIKRFPGSLLFEPEQHATSAGQPFKVFSPFWKSAEKQSLARLPINSGEDQCFVSEKTLAAWPCDQLADWRLLPQSPNWAEGFQTRWTPGESGAWQALEKFIDDGAIDQYADGRDHPAIECTSCLSPHLAWGEISPSQVRNTIQDALMQGQVATAEAEKFQTELGWREFCQHLLFHSPTLPEKAWNTRFSEFPWRSDLPRLEQWQSGRTGIPMVDAGMRQLWQTGWMHNRVRMIVASFLVKNLLIPWQEGQRWFWDTLVDADLASNAANWQWVAGSGADAAPYFRIFNPVLQGQRFDAKGHYIRQWVPELSALPDKWIHKPWLAPAKVLEEAAVELGVSYPKPIVDLKESRQRALEAYQQMRDEMI